MKNRKKYIYFLKNKFLKIADFFLKNAKTLKISLLQSDYNAQLVSPCGFEKFCSKMSTFSQNTQRSKHWICGLKINYSKIVSLAISP